MNELAQKLKDMLALRSSYRRVFDQSDSAQRVLRHLCKVGFVGRTTFVHGDSHQTARNEGMREIVVSILRFIHRDDDALRKQIEQAYEQEQI